LEPFLKEIVTPRNERIVYVAAASSLEYGEVTEFIDTVRSVGTTVRLLTPDTDTRIPYAYFREECGLSLHQRD
jgi:biopolymer transport protein ExbD